jgi:hypothetical protein
MTKAKNNRHEDDDTKPLSLCVRGMRIEGGEEDDKLCHFLSFTRATKTEKEKNTKMIVLCHHLCVWNKQKEEEEAKKNDDQRLLSSFVFHRNDRG